MKEGKPLIDILCPPQTKQLGDLPPGEWFDRGNTLRKWVVTNHPEEREGFTLCVAPTTGETEWVDNSEKVYPIARPY
mgnify:CR=1 FL=1